MKYYLWVARLRLQLAFRTLVLKFKKPIPHEGQRLIWIKTPKCGGTSVKNTLEDLGYLRMMQAGKAPITGIYSDKVEEFKSKNPELWNSAFKFAIVRNPYDKFVSGWKYLKRTKNKPLKEVLLDPPGKKPRNHDWLHLTRTQSEPLTDKEGKLIVNEVVHFENLMEELNRVIGEKGLKPIQLSKENRTKDRKKDYLDYFDSESKQLLNQRYQADFKNFGYDPEL